ncbi:MAG: DNA polymerase III subunit alpha, partial [Bacteroidetes bacterium]
MKPRELLEIMQSLSIKSLALTDINNTSSGLEFVRLAPSYKIKPVLGIDFRNGVAQNFVALAKNNKGYQELNDYLSHHLQNKEPIPSHAPDFANAYVVYPFTKAPEQLRSHEFVGLSMQQIPLLRLSKWLNRLSQ